MESRQDMKSANRMYESFIASLKWSVPLIAAIAAIVVILIATFCRSLVQIQIRELVKTDHTAAIVFWFSMTATAKQDSLAPLIISDFQ